MCLDRPSGRRSKEAKIRRYIRRFSFRGAAKSHAEFRTGMFWANPSLFNFPYHKKSVYHDCKAVPGEFMKKKPNVQVQEIVLLKYGKSIPARRAGNVEVPCPAYVKTTLFRRGKLSLVTNVSLSTVPRALPDFLVKGFGNVISVDQAVQLMAKWQAFVDTGVKPKGKKHETCSSAPAFYFGVWRRYKTLIHITTDTKSSDPIIWKACDDFLILLRDCVASQIATYMENYAPRIWKHQKK